MPKAAKNSGNPGKVDDVIVIDSGGNTVVDGKPGDDRIVHNVSASAGASNHYKGGAGIDTLQLDFTAAEWMALNPGLQDDLTALLAFMAANTNPTGQANGNTFQFSTLDLSVKQFENLVITVDGIEISAADDAVTAAADAFTAGENDIVTGNVLADNGNGADQAPDLVASVSLVTGPSAGSLTLNADGTFEFDPGTDFDYLNNGETADVTFEYMVTDADGDTDTATATITLTGENDSGPLDIVAVGASYDSYGYYYDSFPIGVMDANGDGTYQPPVGLDSAVYYYYYGDQYLYAVALGDIDNDGTTDIVTGGYSYNYYSYDTNGISVNLNNGDGTFQAATGVDTGLGYTYYYYYDSYEEVQDIELADLNGDGNLDIVASGYGYSDGYYYYGNGDGMSVLLGNGDGTFQAPTTYSLTPANDGNYYEYNYSRDVDLADFNGDGLLDAVAVNYSYVYYNGGDGGVAILEGNGDGTFQQADNYTGGFGIWDSYYGGWTEDVTSVAVGDIDNDGELDLVVVGNVYSYTTSDAASVNSIGLLMGNGDGTFDAGGTMSSGLGFGYGQYYQGYYGNYANAQVMDVELADLNGDGNLDIVSGGYSNSDGYYYVGSNGPVSVALGNGDGTFQTATVFDLTGNNSQYVHDLEIADLDGDGNLDIIAAEANSDLFILYGNGDGTFDAPVVQDDGLDYTYYYGGTTYDIGAYDIALGDVIV